MPRTEANNHTNTHQMSEFIVRIELNGNSDSSIYAKLHAVLSLKGYSRIIPGEGGKTKQLPAGEYYRISDLTPAQVVDEVKAVASAVWKDVDILAVKSAPDGMYAILKDYTPPVMSLASLIGSNIPKR